MDNHTIIMMEKLLFLSKKIKQMLETSSIAVVSVETESMLLNSLKNNDDSISLLILDITRTSQFGMDFIAEARKRVKDKPIIVLTEAKKRSFFVEALLHGATDFILKPFDEHTLISKVKKYINKESSHNVEFITMDLVKYTIGELRKAEKGGFPLSMMLLCFEDENGDYFDKKDIPSNIFDNMKDLFWDTDIFIKFASKYYLGVFPFCNESNTEIILNKLKVRFDELKNTYNSLKNYHMHCVFTSYPYDSSDTSQIFKILMDRVGADFEDLDIISSVINIEEN